MEATDTASSNSHTSNFGLKKFKSQSKLNNQIPTTSPSNPFSSNLRQRSTATKSIDSELGVALDGSFVETTNAAVAQTLANLYGKEEQAGEFGISTRIDGRGRTIYRIKPLEVPTPISTSSSPISPSMTLQLPQGSTNIIRITKSIPNFSTAPEVGDITGSGDEDLDSISSTPKVYRSPSLRKTGSTPALSTASTPPRSNNRNSPDRSTSNVLGKILGWDNGIEAKKGKELKIVTDFQGENKDLPDQLMELLQENSVSESPKSFASTSGLASPVPVPSSPFGIGVRVKLSTNASYTGKYSFPSKPNSTCPTPTQVRGQKSSDTIKTQQAAASPPPPALPPLTRFNDSTLFDFFQSFDCNTGSSRPNTSETTDESDRSSTGGFFGPSPSVSSSLSDLARVVGTEITVCALPSDDPRFIIWGTKAIPTITNQRTRATSFAGFPEDVESSKSNGGSPATSSSKRWSLSSPGTSIRNSIESSSYQMKPTRILMAATIERWIAELTTSIESDLLTGFFLTYRTFISPVDLCKLLITRFNWALQPTENPAEEAGRRIVRVRTFVVIRHWIINHFFDDFVPEKELRTLLTGWLNLTGARIDLKDKDKRLIKSLKKLVRKLKENFIAVGVEQAKREEFQDGLGMKLTGPRQRENDPISDEDVDLDINAVTSYRRFSTLPTGALSSASLNLLSSSSSPPPEIITNLAPTNFSRQTAFPLPNSKNIASRTFSNALGSFGRFKRMISSRTLRKKESSMSLGSEVDELEWEAGEAEDLLYVKGGLERYLNYCGIQKEREMEEFESSIQLTHSKSQQTLRSVIYRLSFRSPSPAKSPPATKEEDDDFYFRSTRDSVRIELDDIDLSDEDDDVVEVKKTLRRLPQMGGGRRMRKQISYESIDSPSTPNSPYSLISTNSGPQVIANFILEGISDSEEEELGTVEAALRRLEGQVDVNLEMKKAKKVAEQMDKSSRLERFRLGLGDLEEDNFKSRMNEEGEAAVKAMKFAEGSRQELSLSNAKTVAATESVTILPLRNTSRASRLPIPPFSRLKPLPPQHKSFLLSYKTSILAQQFTLIEMDLFRILSWQELIAGDWLKNKGEVRDWELYLKERRVIDERRKKSGERVKDDVDGIVNRFNLTANWVCSEIILTTNFEERVNLIAKFIRLAFKCYRLSNFQTTTSIVHGLQMEPILALKKTWSKVPKWEMREFKGLKSFVSENKNFKYLRLVTNALVEEYGVSGSESRRMKSKLVPTGCIPFLGLFLRDLSTTFTLPTFLDPTCPTESARIDEHGNLISIIDENSFAGLNPLPNNLPLLPLINVHKFRLLSELVTKVLGFQDFSLLYQFPVEKEVYFKCLKIKTVEMETLQQLARGLESG